MKATVIIAKSFNNESDEFTKTYENGDFEEFFTDEGKYLDKLAMVALTEGKHVKGKLFKISIDVIVEN